MVTRHLIAAVSLAGAIALAGCSRRTNGPIVSDAGAIHSEGVSTRPAVTDEGDRSIAGREPGGSLRIEGQPISRDPIAIEEEDTRAGEEADRAGANPNRIPDIEIKNLSRDGNTWIGGEPTDKGYRQASERGVTAVVDLRNPTPVQERSAREARRLGMDYINLPIQPKNMEPEDASAFLDFMRQHESEQVLIHCGSANRASGMYAVYLGAVKGLSTDEAIQRARRTGLKKAELEQDVRRFLDRYAAPRPAP